MAPPSTARDQKTAVVLCTYNGAAFLNAQLNSIAKQTEPPHQILISDDGSTDSSLDIARQFQKSQGSDRVSILAGPQQGYAANFLYALSQVDPDTAFVALSDQDDVWHHDKLARATQQLAPCANQPALYGAATWECNSDLTIRQISRCAAVSLRFEHALTQNFAGGNTMVLNRAGLLLVQESHRRGISVPVHDWWLYQLIAGADGVVLFDPNPCLQYRQHHRNAIGSAAGIPALIKRLRRMLRGDYTHWITANLTSLEQCADLLSPQRRATLCKVTQGRNGSMIKRLSLLRTPGLYRQGILGQLGLSLALILRRF